MFKEHSRMCLMNGCNKNESSAQFITAFNNLKSQAHKSTQVHKKLTLKTGVNGVQNISVNYD